MKPMVVGGVSYTSQNMFIDGKTIRIKGVEYPLAMVASGAVALGSMLAEIAHDYVVPHIHYLDKMAEPSSLALASATTGGGNVGAYYILNPKAVSELRTANLFLLGSVSELIGDSVWSKGLKPVIDSMV